MKNKLSVFVVCFVLSMTLASAFSIENDGANYDRRENAINVHFSKILVNECGAVDVAIIDRKGDVVDGDFISGDPVCRVTNGRKVIADFSKTGSFDYDHEFDLGSMTGFRRFGRLRYEVTDHWDGHVLAKGLVKRETFSKRGRF